LPAWRRCESFGQTREHSRNTRCMFWLCALGL
jgi:hypothetical protein